MIETGKNKKDDRRVGDFVADNFDAIEQLLQQRLQRRERAGDGIGALYLAHRRVLSTCSAGVMPGCGKTAHDLQRPIEARWGPDCHLGKTQSDPGSAARRPGSRYGLADHWPDFGTKPASRRLWVPLAQPGLPSAWLIRFPGRNLCWRCSAACRAARACAVARRANVILKSKVDRVPGKPPGNFVGAGASRSDETGPRGSREAPVRQ